MPRPTPSLHQASVPARQTHTAANMHSKNPHEKQTYQKQIQSNQYTYIKHQDIYPFIFLFTPRDKP